MKRVTELIVGELYDETALPATLVNINQIITDGDWSLGDVVVVKDDGGVLTDANAAAYTGKIRVGQFDNFMKIRLSSPITKKQVVSISAKAQVAEVKQAATIVIPTCVVGEEYGFYIGETANVNILHSVRQLASKVAEVTTAATMATALAAIINANPYAIVTASVSTATITLTAKKAEETFNVDAIGSLLQSAVTQQSVAPVRAFGTVASMDELAQYELGYRGHFNRVEYPVVPNTYLVSTTGYHVITINHSAVPADQFAHGEGYGAYPVTLNIAIKKTGAAANATGANTLASIIGKWATGTALTALEA